MSPAGWKKRSPEIDAAGNLFGRLVGANPDAGGVWVGSHPDSVPNDGWIDGVLGGLEAVERVGRCPRTLAIVAFPDRTDGPLPKLSSGRPQADSERESLGVRLLMASRRREVEAAKSPV